TARIGDGWFGYALDLDATANCIAGIRAACARHSRNFEEIEISVTPRADLDLDLARRYAELGVGRLIISPRVRDVDGMRRAIEAASDMLIGRM
ncbi:MAG TPA: hypothetical protein VJ718_02115, partial [Candidatus Binataceae bacterium]|nr:hypothetical protein [Candidatus Binataceae bacterium]